MPAGVTRSVLFLLLLGMAGCTATFALEDAGYPTCGPNHACKTGCYCFEGRICVPDKPGQWNEDCLDHGIPKCQGEQDCTQFGCHCVDNSCQPPTGVDPSYCGASGVPPTCILPGKAILVESASDDAGDLKMTLRQAIEKATKESGPHRIVFAPGIDEVQLNSGLPPVPPLTFLDGRADTSSGRRDVRLFPNPVSSQPLFSGLVIQGAGVVVAGIKVDGFAGSGVVIAPGSSDVHLFQMDVRKNAAGIIIGDPSNTTNRIAIGRGKELGPSFCINDANVTYQSFPEDYDINVIVNNMGDGIRATNTKDLLIEGTWVGFSNRPDDADTGHTCSWGGNHGMGIDLENVQQAFVGAKNLSDQELRPDIFWDLAATVAVGRSGGHGVYVHGGGDIDMTGLLIGDTPIMDPYCGNTGTNLRIEGNTGPVFVGPRQEAEGRDASQMALIHTDFSPLIEIADPQADIWVRGAQIQCIAQDCGNAVIVIKGAKAKIDFVQLTLVGYFVTTPGPLIKVSNVAPGGSVNFINDFFWSMTNSLPYVMEVSNTDPVRVLIQYNVKSSFDAFCTGNCPLDDGTNQEADWSNCSYGNAFMHSPGCPGVDQGKDLSLDLNGPMPGHFVCKPDIGAFDCHTAACLAVCP